MKYSTNWKMFFILLVASVASGFLVIPYILALSPSVAEIFTPVVIMAQVVQFFVLFSIAIYFGLRLGGRVGLGLPILEGFVSGENRWAHLKSILPLSIGLGVFAGVLIILLSFMYPSLSLSILKTESAISVWKLLIVPFYGGIAEEVLLRLFVMTFLVWISFKIKKTADGKPTIAGVWTAIVLTSVLFGLGHLPITADLASVTATVVGRAILLNGVAGVIFGWLYYKKGLESAVIAHASADIVLHVVTPLVARVFIN